MFPGDSEIGTILQILKLLGTPSEETWPGYTQLKHWKNTFPRWPNTNFEPVLRTRPELGEAGIDLIRSLLNMNPSCRMRLRRAKAHTFFLLTRENAEGEDIAQIDHPDPPAQICATEAQQCERAQWETSVEALISNARLNSTGTTANPIMILTFGRNTAAFDAALNASGLVQRVVSMGGVAGPSWANGAKILTPEVTEEIWYAAGMQIRLMPCHVIIHSEDIPELEQVMQGLSYHSRPRPKRNKPPAQLTQEVNPRPVDPSPPSPTSHPSPTDAYTWFQDLSPDGAGSAADLLSDDWELVTSPDSCSFSNYELAETRDSWVANLRELVLSAQIVHVNVSHTFVNLAGTPPATPRSWVTSSAPGTLGPVCQEPSALANPRIWGNQ